jgi:hypothetical protein
LEKTASIFPTLGKSTTSTPKIFTDLWGFFENSNGTGSPPDAFGWMFVVMGSICILFGWGTAILILIAGGRLTARRNRMFCMVVAGIECMFMPIGTVLGGFTILLLNKDSVKQAFELPRETR